MLVVKIGSRFLRSWLPLVPRFNHGNAYFLRHQPYLSFPGSSLTSRSQAPALPLVPRLQPYLSFPGSSLTS
ncbi:hypothetical protein, partial [Desulfonatronospira sp.]|uniref:hypothetical protein n=1 Tax=Desulfonatronospira sp. TaxID=1962951 RepID=UPI0025B7F866